MNSATMASVSPIAEHQKDTTSELEIVLEKLHFQLRVLEDLKCFGKVNAHQVDICMEQIWGTIDILQEVRG